MFTKTKNETVTIFDGTKIGIGDIVEYDQSNGILLKKKRVAGIVIKVEEDVLVICEKDWLAPYDTTREFGLPVDRAAEVKVLHRHPANLK